MKRRILATVVVLFMAASAHGGDLLRDYERELAAKGYAVDDGSLRVLVRRDNEAEEIRTKAAMILAYRRALAAEDDIQAAIASGLTETGLTTMATALLTIDAARFEPVALDIAGTVGFEHKFDLAVVLAAKGRPVLYPVLLEGLKAEDSRTRHRALFAVDMLARRIPPDILEPDAFAVLISEAVPSMDSPSIRDGTSHTIRKKAVQHLFAVLCHAPQAIRAVAGLRAFLRAAENDRSSEVRDTALVAYNSVVAGLLAGEWPPYCADPSRAFDRYFRFYGRSVEDHDLRSLLKSETESEDLRLKAALLLAQRGVTAAAPDARAVQSSNISERAVALLSHVLLNLKGPSSVEVVVDAAATRLTQPDLRLYVAQDLAHRGEPALYEDLLESLRSDDPISRHVALGAVAALSRQLRPGELRPDPVKVLIRELSAEEVSIRLEAAFYLADAVYLGPMDELRLEAVQTLRKVAEGDPAAEVRQTAVETLKALEETPAEGRAGEDEERDGDTKS